MMKQKNFFSPVGIIWLCKEFIITIVILIIIYSQTHGIDEFLQSAIGVGVFGVAISVYGLACATQSLRNIRYLKKNGYYERMCMETPDKKGDCICTQTFIFNSRRRLCIPIQSITSYRIESLHYNKTLYSWSRLRIFMDDESSYVFLHYKGRKALLGEAMCNDCVKALQERNPNISFR